MITTAQLIVARTVSHTPGVQRIVVRRQIITDMQGNNSALYRMAQKSSHYQMIKNSY